ncbi:MAG: hypothetical protein Q9160_009072 [Pyrenula sp. 1 TL-2023]
MPVKEAEASTNERKKEEEEERVEDVDEEGEKDVAAMAGIVINTSYGEGRRLVMAEGSLRMTGLHLIAS